MKQVCRDESIVSVFFPYLNIYCTLHLHIKHCIMENLKDRLPICIHLKNCCKFENVYKYINVLFSPEKENKKIYIYIFNMLVAWIFHHSPWRQKQLQC